MYGAAVVAIMYASWVLGQDANNLSQYLAGGAAIAFLVVAAGFVRNTFKMNQVTQETVIGHLQQQVISMQETHTIEITALRDEHVACQRELGALRVQVQTMRATMRKAGLDPDGGRGTRHDDT